MREDLGLFACNVQIPLCCGRSGRTPAGFASSRGPCSPPPSWRRTGGQLTQLRSQIGVQSQSRRFDRQKDDAIDVVQIGQVSWVGRDQPTSRKSEKEVNQKTPYAIQNAANNTATPASNRPNAPATHQAFCAAMRRLNQRSTTSPEASPEMAASPDGLRPKNHCFLEGSCFTGSIRCSAHGPTGQDEVLH